MGKFKQYKDIILLTFFTIFFIIWSTFLTEISIFSGDVLYFLNLDKVTLFRNLFLLSISFIPFFVSVGNLIFSFKIISKTFGSKRFLLNILIGINGIFVLICIFIFFSVTTIF